MKRLFTMMALLTFAGAHASDGDLLKGVRARMADAPVLRGQFVQEKTVTGFKKPLVSRGDFLIERSAGVLWSTREPFPSTLAITRTSLTADQGAGTTFQLDAAKEPALVAVNELLLALLSGDTERLARHFEVKGALVGAVGWSLELKPSDAGLSRVFRSVHLEGDRYVRQVKLVEARGDVSVIRFEAHAQTPPPTPVERERLAN
jgi:Outer membrane lipoprotein carrier protein LolA